MLLVHRQFHILPNQALDLHLQAPELEPECLFGLPNVAVHVNGLLLPILVEYALLKRVKKSPPVSC